MSPRTGSRLRNGSSLTVRHSKAGERARSVVRTSASRCGGSSVSEAGSSSLMPSESVWYSSGGISYIAPSSSSVFVPSLSAAIRAAAAFLAAARARAACASSSALRASASARATAACLAFFCRCPASRGTGAPRISVRSSASASYLACSVPVRAAGTVKKGGCERGPPSVPVPLRRLTD